jgi:Skp family chaperone for outer membrane proteins
MNSKETIVTRPSGGFTRTLLVVLAAASLTACGGAKSNIGLIDTNRITSNWPKFVNYQNQIASDQAAIEHSRVSTAEKARERGELRQRFASAQNELTEDVRTAAQQVAADKHLTYVFTRQYVGYGGVDITPDVEKLLKIVETATPSP